MDTINKLNELVCGYSWICSPSWGAFFSTFWPDLSATLIGVFLGFYFANAINRKMSKNDHIGVLTLKTQRLDRALQALEITINGNTELLKDYNEKVITKGNVKWGTQIDSSAWDAVGGDLVGELTPANFRRSLAHYFKLVKDFEQLNLYYYNLVFDRQMDQPHEFNNLSSVNAGLQSLIKDLVEDGPKLVKEGDRVLKGCIEHVSKTAKK